MNLSQETSPAAKPSFESTPLGARWRAFFEAIVSDSQLNARFLNTLSLLEHMGSRKILKALDSYTLDEVLLRHIAEEARHAHFFKRLSLRVAEGACETYAEAELLAGGASRKYFQSLDHEVADYLSRRGGEPKETLPKLTYLCVTTLIELRAMELYPCYERVLQQANAPISLRSVIAEEDRHLSEMRRAFAQLSVSLNDLLPPLSALEAPLFDRWITELEKFVNPSGVRSS